ncbi:serine hydrolase [Flavobacterium sp.]|uniref:serine hydrolase domain-containing protein n=1 Tax=Flavobacterium sp. TaxID=239 RepID=UPI00286E7E0C|nr:serine hydrolase [Flavobacterium sp.]
MKNLKLLLLFLLPLVSCNNDDEETVAPIITNDAMYFPSNTDTNWETKSLASLGWNQSAVQPLKDYLILKNTKSFIILVNGRIVMEEYFNGHAANTSWQWNSAGKTLVSATTGIAQQEGLLNINNKVSDYIGTGWTSEPIDKENLIKTKNLLTMTSGISDASNLVITSNLTYVADAGTRWAYGNVFQKLMDVVAGASNQNFETYFDSKLKNKIGMDGFWNNGIIFKVYNSNSRSMARFGLLALNKGKWKNETILNETFFNESTTTSQNINPSYGYLWWLNGKSSFMIPGSQNVFPNALVSNAPADMYAAMGAEDQRIYVIPSKNMVIIRMGTASDPGNPTFAVSGFDNELWLKINDVIN